ncbi:MAG: HAD-IB family hydrolase [Chloroflexi bacterium]|nr:HAD-IB family hydrolase [Chloroflexota bacterium]
MQTAAFFDVDGTLYTANMWRGLMQYVAEHGYKTRTRMYFYGLLPLYFFRKLRLISEEDFRKPWVTHLGSLVQGWSATQGDAAFRWVAEQYIRPTARDDIIAKLREHLAQDHPVFLVSAMLEPTLRLIGEALGATGVIGTSIEMKDGHLSGRVSSRVCMGTEKQLLTREFLAARGIEIDFAASYAYADSISDMALFEMVGHPVAVYPDAHLAEHARANRWEILPG